MITMTFNTLGLICAVVTVLSCIGIAGDNELGEGLMWTLFTVVLALIAYVIGCGISTII
jgi:hypothetical protein